MNFFSVVSLLGGLALFLYGMTIMGGGLEKLAGSKTESILQKLTSSTTKGVVLGAVITAIIQSSSGATVIVIGLVNSGIMKFSQALGVIMGANIGTTVTGQILRLSDISGDNFFLKLLKPSTLAPAVAFIGIIFFLFFKSTKKRNIGQILMGFGILFTGMFAMEAAVLPLRESPWFIELFSSLQNPILGILAGMLVTAVIQSSSASVGILQAITATGAITWGSAIPIILGQNIGTCATGLIASAGASRAAKRVAFAHLYFNMIGTAVFVGIIYGCKAIFGIPFWGDALNKGDVANFHTLFNVVSTLLFIPFSWVLVWLSEKTVPDKKGKDYPELAPTILDERLFTSPSVAVAQARKAVEQMAVLGHLNQTDTIPLLFAYNEETIRVAQQREDVIDKLDVSIANYLVHLTQRELSEYESGEVTSMLNFVTEFERVGDHAINVVERSVEVYDKGTIFSPDAKRELRVLNTAVSEIMEITIRAFVHDDLEEAGQVEPLEETIDLICETLRDRHIGRLQRSECSIEAGVIFLEVINNYERISDHCSNVAARMISASLEDGGFDAHKLRRTLHQGRMGEYNEQIDQYHKKYMPLLNDETTDTPALPQAQPVG